MEHFTGHHLFTTQGDDIGEIVDVLGADGPDLTPSWLTVKTGWFSSRLVPYGVVEPRGEQFVTTLAPDQIAHAPKVPTHFEPAGDDRDELCRYYGISV